ncbi:hypothetical protein [Kamptonema formosum]|nr:hypothetical protein [Oscillatoria sp. PCC 10802]
MAVAATCDRRLQIEPVGVICNLLWHPAPAPAPAPAPGAISGA